jgi:hypothetical protein
MYPLVALLMLLKSSLRPLVALLGWLAYFVEGSMRDQLHKSDCSAVSLMLLLEHLITSL